jgi:hypothetical protein
VHNGAIQVLVPVARCGREISGETAQLAELAGEQERTLRRLVNAVGAELRTGAMADVGALPRAGWRKRSLRAASGSPNRLWDG